MAIQGAPLQGEDCDEARHAAVTTVSGMGDSQLYEKGKHVAKLTLMHDHDRHPNPIPMIKF